MGDVLTLPLPWTYTKRQLEQMDDTTFESVRPQPPQVRASDDWTAYNEYRNNRRKWDAEQRRRVAAAGPHPNWSNRKKLCAVYVEVECGSKRGSTWGYKGPHRARWERLQMECGRQAVAWDGTDRRRVGYLWGVCADHIRQAMGDDESRTWYWHTGVVIDENFDLEGELVLGVLGA